MGTCVALNRHEPWNPKQLVKAHVGINIKDCADTRLDSLSTISTSYCTKADKYFVSDSNFSELSKGVIAESWFSRIILFK